VFPFLWILLIFFVRFFRLLFQFLQFLFLPIDGFNLFLDFSDLSTINPDVFALFVGDVLSESNFIIANPLSHFVSFHFVALDDVIKHLVFARSEKFFLDFEFLFEKIVFFPQSIKLAFVVNFGPLV